MIPLGPNQTSEALFGGQQLLRHPTDNTDHHTEFREGPLLSWASSENPPVLVLKNADQAPVGLLAPLAGLTRQPRVLHYQGREYRLTEKHRIILTGHPEHYPGRHLDNTLKSRVPTFFYHPLPDSVLARAIILPNLPEAWPDSLKQQACERILTLFNHFRELLPGDLTTPRDITDVLATMRQILSHCPANGITPEQVNALVRRAFMDSLAGAVTDDYQQRLNTLNLWYQGQYREDSSIMTGVDRTFADFLQRLQAANPDGHFSAAPVRQLVYRYWQNLDKDESGRIAILVEGPAGWGKDFVLDRTIRLWQQGMNRPFVHINANPNQWTTLVESVERAMSRGELIAISELNLIPSSYVEELLKNVLTGHAAPGFRLFATINPGYFGGREALSKALTSRCTQVRLGALAREELAGLVQGLADMPDGLPQWLAGHFHQLSTALYQQNCPVQLALDDLFSSARHLAGQRPEQWRHALPQHLSLPFRALTTELAPVQDHTARLEQINKEEQRRLALETVANSLPGLSTPITVKFGSVPRGCDREIAATPQTTEQDVLTTVKVMQQGVGDNSRSTAKSAGHEKIKRLVSVKFGDIVAPEHYKVNSYFPQYPYDTRQYRLCFLQTRLDEGGKLRNCFIDQGNSTIIPLAGWPDYIFWRTDLRSDELPGQIILTLDNQWQPLPALSHSDQLRAIRCMPQMAINLARCEQTGMILIKRRNKCKTAPVTIDFIIAPDQTYFTRLKQGEPVLLQEGLFSQRLEDLLKKYIFDPEANTCKAYARLREIDDIKEISERLSVLANWLDTFSDTQNVTGKGGQLLLNILRKKQGVCGHKAMIFQVLCHYWGIPARQVENASHRFVEISPDGGLTWRKYQLGGGGQVSFDITEPDWGDYRRPDCSVLIPPITRGYSGQTISPLTGSPGLRKRIAADLKELVQQISKNQSPSPEVMHQLKNNYSAFNTIPAGLYEYYFLPSGWWVLLSPHMFHLFGEHLKDWKSIIEESAWNMECQRGEEISRSFIIVGGMEALCNSMQEKEIDVHYLKWLCDLYQCAPGFLKYALMVILQMISEHCTACEVKNRIKLMFMSYPLSPERRDLEKEEGLDWSGLSKSCMNIVKTMSMSRSLLNRLSQHRIHQQLHHQPVGNSTIIPEKLMSGEAAFLNVSKSSSYKPIIFDCSSLEEKEVNNRVVMRLESGMKSENLAVFEKIMAIFKCLGLDGQIKRVFFYWLAAHHMDETVSPIWLDTQYQYYSETAQPVRYYCLANNRVQVSSKAHLTFSPEKIKDYFNRPSAVVLQKDDLLLLLDEFLALL